MRNKHNNIVFAIFVILITLWWIVAMVQTTTLVSYRHWFTAGELFAWITANQYEVSDIANYCLRYVSPWWIGLSILYVFAVGLLWCTTRPLTSSKTIIISVVLVLLWLPFILPNARSNIFREVASVAEQVRNIKEHQDDARSFTYNATRTDTIISKQVYVLSIGESVRYKNLSLNGKYDRETTPSLQKQKNLCLYSDYYANATLTQHAMPMLLTEVTTDNYTEHFAHKTIAAAFVEAGYKTALISHRAQLMNNGFHNYLAQDFDTLLFVEHDSLIAPALGQLIERNENLFVVTHYLGNHMFYTNRTDDCLRYRPDYNANPKAESDSLFLNAYDNSLLYTDRMLCDALNVLDNVNCVSAWLFVSDHGEYISNRVSGHGHTYHPTREEYHVPLMVWYSDAYEAAYPSKVANMIKQKDEPTSADNVFWSVLDMAGIEIEEQQSGMSIFGDTLLPHQRTLLLPDGKSVMELD